MLWQPRRCGVEAVPHAWWLRSDQLCDPACLQRTAQLNADLVAVGVGGLGALRKFSLFVQRCASPHRLLAALLAGSLRVWGLVVLATTLSRCFEFFGPCLPPAIPPHAAMSSVSVSPAPWWMSALRGHICPAA